MAAVKKIVVVPQTSQLPPSRPAMTPEAEENEMISLAMEQAKEQLRNKTAPAQVVCHFLKLGSERERLEKEKIRKEGKLIDAKVETLESAKKIEELYSEAMEAMKQYRMSDDDAEEEL